MGRMTSHVWNHQPAIVFDIHLQLDGIVTYNRGAHLAGYIYIYNWSFLAIRQRFRIIRIKKFLNINKFLKINKFLTHIILCFFHFFPFKHHLRWGKNLNTWKRWWKTPPHLEKSHHQRPVVPPCCAIQTVETLQWQAWTETCGSVDVFQHQTTRPLYMSMLKNDFLIQPQLSK